MQKIKIPSKKINTKTPMKDVINYCIQNEQICYKCKYLQDCKAVQRKGFAKPYQYKVSEKMQDIYFEDLLEAR